ncbi:hypothetical protein DTO021C3_3725 [Paecilomyces variotii]|nr:hypothetical protein DTO021C3_3725 [Paecilomyces variotii]KAJ9391417.1 hypothetical protein DTO063F5_1027 [Paecilomyces variotii]
MHTFCTICGVYIRPSSGQGLVADDLEWHQEIRAVRRVDPDHAAHLTGVGYLNASALVVVPQDSDQSYRTSGIPLESYILFYDSESGAWTFIFHAACWEIMCERVSCSLADEGQLASLLFYMLYCTYWNEKNRIRPGHDFGGAADFQNSPRDPLQDMINKGHCYFAVDPSRFASIDDILHYLGPVYTAPKHHNKAITSTEVSFDIFAKLPMEIIHLILTWMPSNDIQNLRLASRSVSIRSSIRTLSQFFWRSRFSPDFEMGFALPTHLGGLQKGSLEKPSPPKIIVTELLARDRELLRVGSREVFIRSLHTSIKAQSISAVGISTVEFNARRFVSGIRLFIKPDVASECSIGYITSSSEGLFRIAPEEKFAGFELATCDDGIVGVRMILEAQSHRHMSKWVGNIGKGEPDIAFGMLCLRCETSSFRLIGSFDAFKLISLALVDAEQNVNIDHAYKVSERPKFEEFEVQPVWTPDYPRASSLIPKPSNLPYQSYNPILNIDFGGPAGESLGKITRMAAHMEDETAAFVGFTFDYEGNSSVLYGRQGRIEVSFVLNAADGERISEITYEQASSSIGLWSLQVKTSFGRNTTFVPDALRSERPGEPFLEPFPAPFAQNSNNDITYRKETLRAPHGQIITGFTSILGVGSQAFQTLGLQCDIMSRYTGSIYTKHHIKGDNALSAPELCSSVGSYLIGGMASGYYFDQKPSQIIGQWISEVDAVDLDPDERIVEVSICMSKLAFSFDEKFHRGRIVQLSILTSQRRLKIIQSAESLPVGEYIELRFRENRLERLAFFAWAFNSNWDHPRVLSIPATGSERIILWSPSSYSSIFPWMAADRALWEDMSLEGKPDRVVSITAYRNSNYGVKYITGLEFIYNSGIKHPVGYVFGERSGEVQLWENEIISRLEIKSGRYGIHEITFHGKDPRDGRDTDLHTLATGHTETSDLTPTVHQEFDLSNRQCTRYAIGSDGSREPWTPQDLPNKVAEGLWGFNMGDGRLILGIVYSDSE